MYPPQMPIMEALTTLGLLRRRDPPHRARHRGAGAARSASRCWSPSRSTLDILSGGRVRLGVGVGWQAAEYEALGETSPPRPRMDEAIDLLRTCWNEDHIDVRRPHYRATPSPWSRSRPRANGCRSGSAAASPRALRRVGELGDGWLAHLFTETARRRRIDTIHRHAEAAGRDPAGIGLQQMLDLPPRDAGGKAFYADADAVAARGGRPGDGIRRGSAERDRHVPGWRALGRRAHRPAAAAARPAARRARLAGG
jgi:alkanesulfonate monooxygenase SsuD/methylene tetrahydromethanopterin reductase-like flavin-dependent oxidoreductase (luciferase family)